MALRKTFTNQERVDRPLSLNEAWTIARTKTFRGFGLGALMDIASATKDDKLWAAIGAFMQDEVPVEELPGYELERFGKICPLKGMARWSTMQWHQARHACKTDATTSPFSVLKAA
jgi:hypothetical protein